MDKFIHDAFHFNFKNSGYFCEDIKDDPLYSLWESQFSILINDVFKEPSQGLIIGFCFRVRQAVVLNHANGGMGYLYIKICWLIFSKPKILLCFFKENFYIPAICIDFLGFKKIKFCIGSSK